MERDEKKKTLIEQRKLEAEREIEKRMHVTP